MSEPTKVKESAREPQWVPSTHHAVPQPAGHECAEWYEWANPSACDILYALAHTKGERDHLRERVAELEVALSEMESAFANDESASQLSFEREALLKARAILAKERP